jgi:hypothetical protein
MTSPTLRVEVSLADPLAPFAWTVVSGARAAQVNRGRNSELDQIQAGTTQVLVDNRDGDWIADNAASPYYPNLRPLNGLRISADYDDGSSPFVMRDSYLRDGDVLRGGVLTMVLFTGYTASAGAQVYDPQPDATVSLQATDALKLLTATTNWGYFTPASNTSGRWIDTALDRFNNVTFDPWPTGLRNIDAGQWPMQEIRSVGYDTLAYCLQIAESEGGVFFADVQGLLTYHDRAHAYSTPATNWGDTAGTNRYTAVSVDPGTDDHIYNRVTVTCPGTAPTMADKIASDTTSIGHYFNRDRSWTVALASDANGTTRANELLARYKDPHQRITSLTMRSGDWAQILSKDLYDRVTVVLHRPDGGVLTQVSRIEGIQIDTPEGNDWTVTWTLSAV